MNNKGFTLVELLIVVAIIGILGSIVLFSITHVQARSRDSARVADLSQLSKALDLYVNQEGNYPIQPTETCLDGDDVVSTELQSANLVSKTIQDPIYTDTSRCFRYITDAGGTSYNIRYYMETSAVQDKGFNFLP